MTGKFCHKVKAIQEDNIKMKRVILAGTGSGNPRKNVTNDDLTAFLDTSDEWIRTRTGISTRYLATDETVVDLCVKAAEDALNTADMKAEELELIIVASVTPDKIVPNTSSEVQAALGAKKAICFDQNAACSGFLFALSTASAYISSGVVKNALVIGGEILSKIMDWSDRSTCVLFGDGAGAAILKAGEDQDTIGGDKDKKGIIGFKLGTDGSKGQVLLLENRPVINPYTAPAPEPIHYPYVHMEGQAVFKFAVSTVPRSIKELLEETGTDIREVSCFVLHQANLRIISAVAKRLKVSDDKFMVNMDKYGNTSAASIPLALDEALKTGKAKEGDLLVIAGFGGGLTWGSMLIRL